MHLNRPAGILKFMACVKRVRNQTNQRTNTQLYTTQLKRSAKPVNQMLAAI